MAGTTPLVTIVVLNWNGLADLPDCLASLRRVDYPRFQTVLVDNGSSDGSLDLVRQQFPEVISLETGDNLGYAGGNNVGLRYALAQGADYVLLLNDDTVVDPDFLGHLIEATRAVHRVGIAGPTVYYHARPERVWSAGGWIDWRRGQTGMIGLDQADRGQFGRAPREVDFVTGCALLVSRAVMASVGLLDERFFAYYEEIEWSVRARRTGFKILHVPQARIWHKISPGAQECSPAVQYYMTRNRLLFLKATRAGGRAWRHVLLAEYLTRLVSWSVKPRWRHKRAERRAMLQALLDAGRGRWGRQNVERSHA